jgi:hypothetical protein
MCAVTLFQNVLNLEDIKYVMTTCDQQRQPNIMKQRQAHTPVAKPFFLSPSITSLIAHSNVSTPNLSFQMLYQIKHFITCLWN